MSKILKKAVQAAQKLSQGLSQDERREIWPTAQEIGSASDLHGVWTNEDGTRSFLELTITLRPDGTGHYFSSQREDMDWTLDYTVKDSVLTLALEAVDSDGIRYRTHEARLLDGKLLLKSVSGTIAIFVRTGD
jgi:hypothetical protein